MATGVTSQELDTTLQAQVAAIGNTANLLTNAKTDLVSAINEVKSSPGAGATLYAYKNYGGF